MNESVTQETQKLPAEIYGLEKQLEETRLAAVNKTKGLFKRAFLRSWIVLSIVLITFGTLVSEEDGFGIINVIGPVMISLVLSLIGAGVYLLVHIGSSNFNFAALSKKSLIPKIITFVNPDLTFSDKGITKKEFDKADLFEGHFLISEDTIEATINGAKIVFSECMSISMVHLFRLK